MSMPFPGVFCGVVVCVHCFPNRALLSPFDIPQEKLTATQSRFPAKSIPDVDIVTICFCQDNIFVCLFVFLQASGL